MNLYQRYVIPRLIDLAMRNREVARYRSQLVPLAHGTVIEIGVGSGLNLPFYGGGVRRLVGIDPSQALLDMTRAKLAHAPFAVELLGQSAEALPLADASADTVVTTFTLCSIPDPLAALREMKRVLKPGGILLFAEHGLAPEPSVERWQHRLNPAWRALAGGCNIDRKMDALVTAAGFALDALETGYAKGPRVLSYIYAGRASPDAGATPARP